MPQKARYVHVANQYVSYLCPKRPVKLYKIYVQSFRQFWLAGRPKRMILLLAGEPESGTSSCYFVIIAYKSHTYVLW